MKGKFGVHCLIQTSYIINSIQIQSAKIRKFRFRFVQTTPRKATVLSTEKRTHIIWAKSLWNKIFREHLLTINILSSGIFMMIGDYFSQEIEYRQKIHKERCDFSRLGQMFIVGALNGPPHHYFYKWLDGFLPETANLKTTILKILIDQTVMTPIDVLLFLYPACLLENKTLTEANDELRSKFLLLYLADTSVWPIIQFFNFHYLDTKYRVMFLNATTTLYNIFLSFEKHN